MSTIIEDLILQLAEQSLGIGQQIQSQQQAQAQQATLDTVLSAVNANLTLSQLILQQVLAITAQVSNVANSVNQGVLGILHQIGTPQQDGVPVTLPTTPPAGYGGSSAAIIADAVWAHTFPGSAFDDETLVFFAGNFARSVGDTGLVPIAGSPYFATAGDLWDYPGSPFPFGPPKGNPSTILATDTLLSWLTRESGFTPWSLGAGLSHYVHTIPAITNPFTLVCLLSVQDFKRLQAAVLATSTFTAPVWPGSANVTIGASQALADGLLIPGPLDGVIVHITSVPIPIGFYPFGPIKSFVRAGAVAFVDDHGEAEFPSPLGPDNEVICPKTMAQAAHAYLRLPSGVIGTITPWLRV